MFRKKLFFIVLVYIIFVFPVCGLASGLNDKVTRKACKVGNIYNPGTSKEVRRCKGHSYGKKVNLSAYGLDGELDYVHGMFYIATVRANVLAKSADSNRSSVRIKKKTKVVVLYFKSRKGKAVCRLKNKRTVYIPAEKLSVKYYLYNSSTAYTDAQIEGFVQQHNITSKTKYMFFVSKFNQHGWILTKVNGKWICKYKLGISTGAYTNNGLPNDIYGLKSLQINTHYKNKKNVGSDGRGISYASKTGGNQIHTGQVYHPYTHGCIAMRSKDFKFVYWYLPIHTRVVSY